MPICSYNYGPVLQMNVSRPYFSTRSQGAREKFGVRGRDYSSTCSSMTVVSNCYIPAYITFTCMLVVIKQACMVLASSPGHSQILSRSHMEKNWEKAWD